MTTPAHTQAAGPAPFFGTRERLLCPSERWRCWVPGRGRGTVAAERRFAGTLSGYRVELDGGGTVAVLPGDARPSPRLRLVQA